MTLCKVTKIKEIKDIKNFKKLDTNLKNMDVFASC